MWWYLVTVICISDQWCWTFSTNYWGFIQCICGCFHIYCYLKLFSSFIISLVPILSLGILYIEKESAFEQTLFSLSSFPMMLWLLNFHLCIFLILARTLLSQFSQTLPSFISDHLCYLNGFLTLYHPRPKWHQITQDCLQREFS